MEEEEEDDEEEAVEADLQRERHEWKRGGAVRGGPPDIREQSDDVKSFDGTFDPRDNSHRLDQKKTGHANRYLFTILFFLVCQLFGWSLNVRV